MSEHQQHENPVDPHREGLEKLERAPHHQTTEHDKPPHAGGPQPPETPGEAHRGGPLPNQKR
jgi:hypothetical protein